MSMNPGNPKEAEARAEGAPLEETVQDTSWESAFEALLDEYAYARPKRGQIINGEIIRVDDDAILVDVGAKRDAVVPRKDMDRLESDMLEGISRGDQLPVYVLSSPGRYGGDLIVSINKGLEQEDWEQAVADLESGIVHDLKVVGRNRGGVVVQYGRLRGFVPNSHIPGLRRGTSSEDMDQQKEEKIGTQLLLKVIEVDSERRRLILSGRAAQRERRRQRLEELEVGEVIRGRVVNLVDFGAFVDIGGVDGLIHISEIDWARVEHPSEVLERGDELEVKVIGVDVERERVSLSRKALLTNPWETVNEEYGAGDLVEGEVTNVRNFGAFVMLPEGVEGLIHMSEIGIVGPGQPQDVVQPGDKVLTRVLDVQPDRERIKLSLSKVEKEQQLEFMEEQRDEEVEDFDAALSEDPMGPTQAEAVDAQPPEAGGAAAAEGFDGSLEEAEPGEV